MRKQYEVFKNVLPIIQQFEEENKNLKATLGDYHKDQLIDTVWKSLVNIDNPERVKALLDTFDVLEKKLGVSRTTSKKEESATSPFAEITEKLMEILPPLVSQFTRGQDDGRQQQPPQRPQPQLPQYQSPQSQPQYQSPQPQPQQPQQPQNTAPRPTFPPTVDPTTVLRPQTPVTINTVQRPTVTTVQRPQLLDSPLFKTIPVVIFFPPQSQRQFQRLFPYLFVFSN